MLYKGMESKQQLGCVTWYYYTNEVSSIVVQNVIQCVVLVSVMRGALSISLACQLFRTA